MALRILAIFAFLLTFVGPAAAQQSDIQSVLQEHRAQIIKSSRKTIEPAIAALRDSGLPEAQAVLQKWQSKELWVRKSDELFVFVEEANDTYSLIDIANGEVIGTSDKKDLKQLKPNSGVRAMIGAALVQFQLTDPDPVRRRESLLAIERDGEAAHLPALIGSVEGETDPDIKALKERLVGLLTIQFGEDEADRVAAIEAVSSDIGVDVRGKLNPLLAVRRAVVEGQPPETENVARVLKPDSDDLGRIEAYDILVDAGLAPAQVSKENIREALAANISDGQVGGVPVKAGDSVAVVNVTTNRYVPGWSRPDEFNPSRFIGADSDIGAAADLSFGTGPRACVGKYIAKAEARAALAALLSRYEFRNVDGMPHAVLKATLAPATPRMLVRRRR